MFILCSHMVESPSYKGPFPVYGTYEGPVQPVEAFDAILNTSETSKVVCSQRPVGITEAAVFLVNTSKLRHHEDIRADDVGSWCHKGKPVRFYSIEQMPSGEVHGAQCCDKGNDGAFKLTRIYYHHKGTLEFFERPFFIFMVR